MVFFFFFCQLFDWGNKRNGYLSGQPATKPGMCFLANFGTCFEEKYWKAGMSVRKIPRMLKAQYTSLLFCCCGRDMTKSSVVGNGFALSYRLLSIVKGSCDWTSRWDSRGRNTNRRNEAQWQAAQGSLYFLSHATKEHLLRVKRTLPYQLLINKINHRYSHRQIW